jgi:hypothetical protein
MALVCLVSRVSPCSYPAKTGPGAIRDPTGTNPGARPGPIPGANRDPRESNLGTKVVLGPVLNITPEIEQDTCRPRLSTQLGWL